MRHSCVSCRFSCSHGRHFRVFSQLHEETKQPFGLPRFPRNLPTIFGPYGRPHQVSLQEQVGSDGGSGRLWSPFVQPKVSPEAFRTLPVMFYLPGFDGTGIAGTSQFPLLMEAFDFMTFTIPVDDRTPFATLVDIFASDLKQYIGDCQSGRPVYLLGESFGALLALAAAAKCPEHVDRLVLVNPATSYEQSIWPILAPLIPQIPNELYTGVSFALAPLLGNPLLLLAHRLDTSKPLQEQADAFLQGVLELFGTLFFVGEMFTPERLSWKIKLVEEGIQMTQSLIPTIEQRTLLLVSDGDWMLPSRDEKDRLAALMPRCRARSMGLRSHALLQEAGVDLVQILKEEGFYVTERKFTSQNGRRPKLNAFGKPLPIELPTKKEIEKASYAYAGLKQLHSPVFYTTTSDDRIVPGLDAFPESRPLLLVGNHQLLGPDAVLLVQGVLSQKGILIRGLIHPFIFNAGKRARDEKINGRTRGPSGSPLPADFAATFGGVAVSPRNLYGLLQQGECILLYPGGAREAFKLKNEAYQLFWPEKAEFVRMAAKFEATIVTVAAVGFEDSFDIVMDNAELLKTPVLNTLLQEQFKRNPEARGDYDKRIRGVFFPPLVRPKIPQRQYFLFGRPFLTTAEHYRDQEKCETLYQEIKSDLLQNIAYLRGKAKGDPYGDFAKRMIFENTNGQKQAPSFDP